MRGGHWPRGPWEGGSLWEEGVLVPSVWPQVTLWVSIIRLRDAIPALLRARGEEQRRWWAEVPLLLS